MKKLLRFLFAPRAKCTTVGALAEKFGLTLRGDANARITGIAPIADALPGQLTFYSDEKNADTFKILPIEVLRTTRATVIVVQPEHADDAPAGATLLITDSPRGAMVKILGEIYAPKVKRGISHNAHIERGVFFRKKRSIYVGPFATVSQGAVIEPGVRIESGAFIGPAAVIGANTVIGANAFIDNATIGANCTIHNNASIGKDGFGYTRQDGRNVFMPHAGRVVLGDRVSVGACSCIDRGLMADTKIGEGTKIDNLVQVAHGVIIGRECFLAAGTGIAGGVVAGDRVMFGGHVGISNGVQIGDDAEIGANSGVFRHIKAGEKILGYPATGAMECMRMFAWTRKQVNSEKVKK